jgi:hypothetical protein
MNYLEYFNDIEQIIIFDDLSKFLGVNDDGIIKISYTDVVKTAGHSCATVAGAYLLAKEGLRLLYKNTIPARGYIKVEFKKAPTEDNTGVVASVISNITGATSDFGFGGIPTGQFNRRNLLYFNVDLNCDIRMTRIDTNEQISLNYRPKKIVNPMDILMSAIKPDANINDINTFPERFQQMVKTVLQNANKVIEIV